MRFQKEAITREMCEEALPLLAAHYREIAPMQDVRKLDPDFDTYVMAQECGRAVAFTARTPEGELRGYAVFFIYPHPHFRHSTHALQDTLYLRPDDRGKGHGADFILFCDRELKSAGVHIVLRHSTVAHDYSSTLLALGYEPVERTYMRSL